MRTGYQAFLGMGIIGLVMPILSNNLCRAQTAPAPSTDTRTGPFNLFDSRTKYGTNWFPEPLNSDETDGEQEFRLNYTHAEKRGHQETEATVEIEKAFGQLTLELEAPYAYERTREDGVVDRADGIGNVEISARHPVYQYVSPDGFFDYTFGARVEFAIASGSDVSKNTELVGGVFQSIGLGDHFSVQMSAGYSTLFGPGEDAGTRVLEYASVFGYNIDFEHVKGLSRITPIFEIDGETALNKGESGSTALTGAVGAVIAFDSIKWGQPKIVVGYEFPLNDTAREDFNWGVNVGLLLEY